MKYRVNLPEPIWTWGSCLWLELNQREKQPGDRGHLMGISKFSHSKLRLFSFTLYLLHCKCNIVFWYLQNSLRFTRLWAENTTTMFSWMKWPNESRAQSPHSRTSGATASRLLIRELLFHAEEQQRLRERKQGALGLSWFQKYPKFHTVLTTAEQQQLEFLCAQIPPAYAATVLSRYLIATIPFYISMHDTVKSSSVLHHTGLTAGIKNREHPTGMWD